MLWKPYNSGPAGYLIFYNADGSKFSGSLEEFWSAHNPVSGFKNIATGDIILINKDGYIIARTKKDA